MKRCPACGQTYTDQNINFCLNDGELLSRLTQQPEFSQPNDEPPPTMFADDSPPTLMMNSARITNQTNWQQPAQPIQPWQPSGHPQQQFAQFANTLSPNQAWAIVSMCLGIGSMTVGWCCSTGLVLSPAALITGLIALSMIKKNPQLYGGRGFAIAGIVTGGIFLLFYVFIMIIYGVALIGGGL